MFANRLKKIDITVEIKRDPLLSFDAVTINFSKSKFNLSHIGQFKFFCKMETKYCLNIELLRVKWDFFDTL